MKRYLQNILLVSILLWSHTAFAQVTPGPPIAQNQGVRLGVYKVFNCSTNLTCALANNVLSVTGGGGNLTAKYWIGTADGTLPNAFNLGALTTGLVLNTVAAGTGTPSTYGGSGPCGAGSFATQISATGALSCTAGGSVTSIATTAPLGGGTITTTGTLTCATCLTATAPTNHGVLLGAGTQAVGVTGVGATNTLLHGNTAADPTYSAVVSADLNITTTTCTNQVVSAISATGTGTCHTIVAADTTGLGTVTSVATTSPITGGTITGTGTIACATCVVASAPGAGIAHFAGATQTVTSSAVVLNTDTTGNYVANAATSSPLGGGSAGSAAAALTLTCTTCTTNAAPLTSGTIVIGQGSNTTAVATGTAAAPTINATTGYQLNGTAIRTALALTNTGAYTAINNTTTKTYFGIGADGLITASPLNTAGTRLEMNFAGVFGALIADTVVISVEMCTVSGCASGTVVALAATVAITPTAETNAGWSTSVTCNVYTTGASGTMDCQGFSVLSTAAGTALVAQMQNTAAKTVDLTVNEYVSIAVTWAGAGAPSATDTITLRQFVAKVF